MGLTSGPLAFIVVGWSQTLKTILNRDVYPSVFTYMHVGYICDWHYVSDLLCVEAFSAILYIHFTWGRSGLKLQVPCVGKHCNPRQTRMSVMLVCIYPCLRVFAVCFVYFWAVFYCIPVCSWWLTSAFIIFFFPVGSCELSCYGHSCTSVFAGIYIFIFLGKKPRSKISGSKGR